MSACGRKPRGRQAGAATSRRRRARARRASQTRSSRRRSVRDCARCSSSPQRGARALGKPCAHEYKGQLVERRTMRKLQTQGVHHITINGANRQTSIDFWEGVLGMPFVFEQPNLDNAAESHLYFDPGDGRLDHRLHERGARAGAALGAEGAGHRPPPRVRRLAGDVRADGRAARRARHRALGRQGPRVHGLDLLRGPARPPGRARVVPLRAAGGHTHTDVLLEAHKLRVERATPTSTASTSRTRSSSSSRARRVALRRPVPQEPVPLAGGGAHGHAHPEHPQAERQQPDGSHLRSRSRSRLRGGRRLGEEVDAGLPGEGPGGPDAAARGGRAAEGLALGELRDHAVPLQQARPRPLLSDRSRGARDGRQRDVLLDRHVLSAARARDVSDARVRVSTRARSRRPTCPTS